MDSDGSNLLSNALQYLLAGGAGVLGRVMHHMWLIQRGQQKSWLWIACDLVIALGMGWIVLGLCAWFDVVWQATQSLAIIAGWAGPHVIDKIIERLITKYLGATEQDEDLTPRP
jgi:biotin transporter BioY